MGLYKKGAFTGKTDRMGNEILSGDTVKKRGYGTHYQVNKYGGLSDMSGIPLISVKNWRGEDYEVLITRDSPERDEEEQKAVEAVNEVRAEEMEAKKQSMVDYEKTIKNLTQQVCEAEALANDYKATVDYLEGHVTQLDAELKEASRAKTAAESRPLSSYDIIELLAEVKERQGWMDYVTNDEIKEELAKRGFAGQMIRTYTVTMNEVMDLTNAAV